MSPELEKVMMETKRRTPKDPLAALMRQVEDARRWDEGGFVAWSAEEDPMEALQNKVEMAREDSQSEGARRLQELEDRIQAARRIPTPRDYEAPERPWEALQARVHGEEPSAKAASAQGSPAPAASSPEPPSSSPSSSASSPTAAPERPSEPGGPTSGALGRRLMAALSHRPLSGDRRAEVASRLAQWMDRQGGDEELQAIWELLVFDD